MQTLPYNDSLRVIHSPVEIDLGDFREYRRKLFESPAPADYFPNVGERVYLRPGVSVGGLLHTEATVYAADRKRGVVTVRVSKPGGRWATRELAINDIRPKN